MTALLLFLAVTGPLALLALHARRSRRLEAARHARLAELEARLDQLQARLEATEQDLATARSRTTPVARRRPAKPAPPNTSRKKPEPPRGRGRRAANG